MLKSSWKRWNTYLSKFAGLGRPIHALEIGSYKGDSATWFLDNLMYHRDSTLTCVDTWEGSPEYKEFASVEEAFDKKIRAHPRHSQVIKMKGLSYDGLIKLNVKGARFDVVYVDASHEARDVIADAVLSWRLLERGGVMIFDDYQWNLLKPDYFTPKPAIDAFIAIMAPEFTVLNIARQAFVEKKLTFERPQKSGLSKYGSARSSKSPRRKRK